jgi:hypothetical protein
MCPKPVAPTMSLMNSRLNYLVATTHIDDLARAAERARRGGAGRQSTDRRCGAIARLLGRHHRRPARIQAGARITRRPCADDLSR